MGAGATFGAVAVAVVIVVVAVIHNAISDDRPPKLKYITFIRSLNALFLSSALCSLPIIIVVEGHTYSLCISAFTHQCLNKAHAWLYTILGACITIKKNSFIQKLFKKEKKNYIMITVNELLAIWKQRECIAKMFARTIWTTTTNYPI